MTSTSAFSRNDMVGFLLARRSHGTRIQAGEEPSAANALFDFPVTGRCRLATKVDRCLLDQSSAEKPRRLRQQFTGRANGLFSSVDELVREVMAAIHVEDSKTFKTALQKGFEECLLRSRVDPMATPNGLANGEKLLLQSSDPGAIVGVL